MTINISELPEQQQKVLLTEGHLHPYEYDESKTLRWKQDPDVKEMINKMDLNNIWVLLQCLGIDKNSEVLRSMYRKMGYSIYGYWEIFYWDMNNGNAHLYVPPMNLVLLDRSYPAEIELHVDKIKQKKNLIASAKEMENIDVLSFVVGQYKSGNAFPLCTYLADKLKNTL